jgi:hypothetical protein
MLNTHQQNIYNYFVGQDRFIPILQRYMTSLDVIRLILSFLDDIHLPKGKFILDAMGGVGKSYVCKELSHIIPVLVLTPTNSSKQPYLKDFDGIVQTVHSMFKFRPKVDIDTGEIKFGRFEMSTDTWDEFIRLYKSYLIVVEEVSLWCDNMLNIIFDLPTDMCIFITGDQSQLRLPGSSINIFNASTYIKQFKLSKSMRTSNLGRAEFLKILRRIIIHRKFEYKYIYFVCEYISKFPLLNWKTDLDFHTEKSNVIICWGTRDSERISTNTRWNTRIRKHYFNNNLVCKGARFSLDEQIELGSVWIPKGLEFRVNLFTCDIIEFSTIRDDIIRRLECFNFMHISKLTKLCSKYDNITFPLYNIDIQYDNNTYTLSTLMGGDREQCSVIFKNIQCCISKYLIRYITEHKTKHAIWDVFHSIRTRYIKQVNLCYSKGVFTTQSMTYNDTYLDLNNLTCSTDIGHDLRMINVAVGRTAGTVYRLNDFNDRIISN